MIPVLGLLCKVFKLEETYDLLVNHVAPLFQDVTYNAWSPDLSYEAVLQDGNALKNSGSSDAFLTMPPNPEQLEALLAEPTDAPAIGSFQFAKHGVLWMGLVASRHFQAQIPHRLTMVVIANMLSANAACSPVGSTNPPRP